MTRTTLHSYKASEVACFRMALYPTRLQVGLSLSTESRLSDADTVTGLAIVYTAGVQNYNWPLAIFCAFLGNGHMN